MPTQTEIQIPADSGCPTMRVNNGKFVFQVPAGPVEGKLNHTASATACPIGVVQFSALQSQERVEFYKTLIRVPRQVGVAIASTGSSPVAVQAAEGTGPLSLKSSLPARIGAQTGLLLLQPSDSERPQVEVVPSGAAVTTYKPQLGASPAPFDFGAVAAGTPIARDLRSLNEGPAPLEIKGWKARDAAFSLSTLATPFRIPAGESVTLSVTLLAPHLKPGPRLSPWRATIPSAPNWKSPCARRRTRPARPPVLSLAPRYVRDSPPARRRSSVARGSACVKTQRCERRRSHC